jgi:hypothetical protein
MLVIKEANYGRGPNYANVTKTLQSLVKDDSIDVVVSPKTMGTDPSIGSTKTLSVIYIADGVQESKEIQDGSTFAIYSTKAKTEDNSPRAKAARGFSNILTTVLQAFAIFLHLAGVGIAYNVGTALLGEIMGYILTAVALIIPFYGLWGVPLIVFAYRLFTGSNLGVFETVAKAMETGPAPLK